MLVNLLIGVVIFGYAVWTLVGFIRRSKEGKCGACDLNRNCKGSCSSSESENNSYFEKMN